MNGDVIIRKLDSLRHCLERLEEKRPVSRDKLADDHDLQDIICINLERAVQLSVDLGLQLLILAGKKPPDTMAEVFTLLSREKIINEELSKKLRSSVGFRNIAVHEYEEIDWSIVFSLLSHNLEDFRVFLKVVMESGIWK